MNHFFIFASIVLASGARGSSVCTEEQVSQLQAAFQSASSTVSPTSFDSFDAFWSAVLPAMRDYLNVTDIAESYPCFSCLETFTAAMYNCAMNTQCDETQMQSIAADADACALGTNSEKSSIPAAVGFFVTSATLVLTLL